MANKLEDAGKIESWSYAFRVSKPGYKVLMRPGHEIEHPNQVPRLTSNEKLLTSRQRSVS
jgi:hypothetical protein